MGGCGSASSTETRPTTSGQTFAAACCWPENTRTLSTCCCRRRLAARGSTSSFATSSSTTTCRGIRCGSSSVSAHRPVRAAERDRGDHQLRHPGTVDADIYERCLSRIGVFEHAVGGSEEILGKITEELHNIADSFTLSPEERTLRFQQLAITASDRSVRSRNCQQRSRNSSASMFRIKLGGMRSGPPKRSGFRLRLSRGASRRTCRIGPAVTPSTSWGTISQVSAAQSRDAWVSS